jgi:hypothetical protein
MKGFSETKPVVGLPAFESQDWTAAQELAAILRPKDFIDIPNEVKATLLAGLTGAAKQRRQSDVFLQMEDAYSTVLQAIKEARINEFLESSRKALGRRQYKHSNPYALELEAVWGWNRSDACRNGVIQQYAARNAVPPRQLRAFIRKHGGLGTCLTKARMALAGDNSSDRQSYARNSRMSVVLPAGEDMRKLIGERQKVVMLVEPKAGGSPAILNREPWLQNLLVRLSQTRKRKSAKPVSVDDDWDN